MIRAFQWDLARQLERPEWLLALLPRYADWGYQELYLHLEDAVEYPSLPGVARPGAFSQRQLASLVRAADRVGIKVVPIVNLLGHTQYLIKVPALRDLNELRAPDGSPLPRGQICPVHPRTLEVADKLLRDMSSFCTAGKVHVGLDESFHLGKHPLSRADIARRGVAAHFAAYVGRLHELAASRGLRTGIWADMLYFLPGAIPLLPRGLIAYDWYYYSFQRHPRVELFNFVEYDLVPALRTRGIEYWGCPMNGAFRHEPLPVFGERLENIRSWWKRCRRTDAAGMLVTSWESSRLAAELPTVVDAAAAELWLNPGAASTRRLLSRGFERVFKGGRATECARVALAADRCAFAGYARGEINDRWDICAGLGSLGKYEAELRHFERLESSSGRLPQPLASSVAFRRVLAARDVFVRRSARAVFQLRRWLSERGPTDARILPAISRLQRDARVFGKVLRGGTDAANRMWSRSRPTNAQGPNISQMRKDLQRLGKWILWLKRARKNPAGLRKRNPVCGAWQLTMTVINFAPALQKVVVQERSPDGTWTDLHARFTIEFRNAAAQPRADIRREFSVPVAGPGVPLRVVVRGVGLVKITRPVLTDGVAKIHPRGWSRTATKVLGRAAATRGFPALDVQRDITRLSLPFSHSVT